MTQPPSSPYASDVDNTCEAKIQATSAPEGEQDEMARELRELVLNEMRRRDQFRDALRTFLAKNLQETDDLLRTLLAPDEGLDNLLQDCLDLVGVKRRGKEEIQHSRQDVDSGISNSMTVSRGSSIVSMRTPSSEIRHRNRRQAGVFSGESWRNGMTIAEFPDTSSGATTNSAVEHNELNS